MSAIQTGFVQGKLSGMKVVSAFLLVHFLIYIQFISVSVISVLKLKAFIKNSTII